MTRPELYNMRHIGGLKGAKQLFGRDPDPGPDYDIKSDTAKQEFAQWVEELAALTGKDVQVRFVNKPDTNMEASCTANTNHPVIYFNVPKFSEDFFTGRGHPQLCVVIHELAHSFTDAKMSHGLQWGESCAKVGAILLSQALDPDNSQKAAPFYFDS